MKTLIILSAPPGSGKSTWAKKYQKEHPHTYIISSDDIRYELTHSLCDFTKQQQVWELFSKRIHEYANKDENVNVILDALCDLNTLRIKYVKENPEYDRFVLVLFPHSFEEISYYNTQRDDERILPEDAMVMLYNKFEKPTDEVLGLFDEIVEVRF